MPLNRVPNVQSLSRADFICIYIYLIIFTHFITHASHVHILVRYMAVSVHPLYQQLVHFSLFLQVFRQVRISYGLDDINLPKNIKHHFPGLCFIEARWSATQRLGAQPTPFLCDKWPWLCSQALGCASSRRDEAQPWKNDVLCSLVYSSEIRAIQMIRC